MKKLLWDVHGRRIVIAIGELKVILLLN